MLHFSSLSISLLPDQSEKASVLFRFCLASYGGLWLSSLENGTIYYVCFSSVPCCTFCNWVLHRLSSIVHFLPWAEQLPVVSTHSCFHVVLELHLTYFYSPISSFSPELYCFMRGTLSKLSQSSISSPCPVSSLYWSCDFYCLPYWDQSFMGTKPLN